MCSTFVFRKEQGGSNDDDVDHVAVAVHCTGSVVAAAMELGGRGLGRSGGLGARHCQTHGIPDLNLSIECISQVDLAPVSIALLA